MQTEALEVGGRNREILAALLGAGERLSSGVSRNIVGQGRTAVPALIAILEDDALAQADAPGDGFAPLHAAQLLADLKATEAIEPMLRALCRCDPLDMLFSALIHALETFGPTVLEPALAAYSSARTDAQRVALADVLSRTSARDERSFRILLEALEHEAELGAGFLAEYGDPRALPHLSATLDARELDLDGGIFGNQELIELAAAIEELGGKLTPAQTCKLDHVDACCDRAIASSWTALEERARSRPRGGSAADRAERARKKKQRRLKRRARRRNRS